MDLISWWHPKPCCASCGQCSSCGASLEGGGYEWNGKKFCSEACTRAGGYRDNPASKSMARIDRLIHHGWKPTMAEYMVLREAEGLGFTLRVTCMNSPQETGRSSEYPPGDQIRYLIGIKSPAKSSAARSSPVVYDRQKVRSFENTLTQLRWNNDTPGAWLKHALVNDTVLDEPAERVLTGISVSRSNPYRPTMPRYAVYQGKKVVRRFHDERNAILFAENNCAQVWDNVRGREVSFGSIHW